MKNINERNVSKSDYRLKAEKAWAALHAEGKINNAQTLEEQLKAAQIRELEWQFYNEDLLKKQASYETELSQVKKQASKLKLLIENSPANIFLLDKAFRIKYINYTVPDLNVEDVVGASAFDFIPIDYQELAKESYEKCFNTGKPTSFVTKYDSQDGTYTLYFSADVVPLFEGDEVVEIMVTSTDITKRKLKDAELKKMSLIAQKTDNAVIILDEETRIEWVNEGFEKMTGYTSEDALGEKLNELLSDDDLEWNFEQALLTSRSKTMVFAIPAYTKTQELYWRSTTVTPFTDSDGLSKYIVIESDITEQKRIADVLKESEELILAKNKAEKSERGLKEAQRIAHIGNWELDSVTGEESWSDEIFRILELDKSDIKPGAEAFLGRIHPEDRERAHEAYLSLVKNKKSYQCFYRLLLDNGKIKYVSERCWAEFDEAGKPLRSMGTLQDITEEKNREEDLTKSLKEIEYLKYAIDQSAMVLAVDREHKIIAANVNFCIVSGYEATEIIGLPFDMIDTDYHSKWFLKEMWNAVQNGQVWKGELKYRAKDDQTYWVDVAVVPFVEDAKTPDRYVFIQRNITEKKNLEEELELANEAEFAKLYQQQKALIAEEKMAHQKIKDLTLTLNQIAIVMIIGRNEQILSVNEKFCEISGYTEAEVLGKHHDFLDSFYHPDTFWKALKETLVSGEIWHGEIKERAKDGSYFWTDTFNVPFFDLDNNLIQCIVIQTDITERKQLEAELHQTKEEAVKNAKIKEDFLANMSHEIRTPMSGVLGFSRLLLQTQMDETQRNYAQSIYTSAENLLVVVNDILDVSKIESGKFQLEEIEFNLEKRITDTLNILKISIENKNLDLRIEIDPKIPTQIIGAPNRIAQVLINLIGNSIKFTKAGFIELNVRLTEDQEILFEVKDSGIGIPEDKLDAIFESFTQAESYTTREHGGTGLGLSICKKLVALMKGRIGVESKVDEGATFYFTIPYQIVSEGSTSKKNLSTTIELSAQISKDTYVLVVEDNLVNQELALIYLDILNCKCDLVNNGAEALEKLAEQEYDLVLMDIQMPKMDGIAATIKIREQDLSTPIIAMTAHALKKEKEKCFEIGMNDYIAKPFKIEDLHAVILKYTKAKPKDHKLDLSPQPLAKRELSSNFGHLVQVMDGNKELAQELLLIFKGELLKFSNNMDLAFESEDYELIRKQIHKIKPNFELLQLMDLYAIGDEIHELVAKKESFASIREAYQKIEIEIPNLLEQIEAEV